jgi:PAS domain S-box-containing protein
MLKNRHTNGGFAFIITLLFSSLWTLGTAMESSVPDLSLKIFWAKFSFSAYMFGLLAFFVMVLQITDRHHWLNRKTIFLLSLIPLITISLVWTNDFHRLIWQNLYLNGDGTLTPQWGLWFWVHAVYSEGLNLFSVILLMHFRQRSATLYSKHFKYLAFSMIFIMVVNAIYTLGIGPVIDLTPIANGMANLFITWALFRNKLFNIVPIARTRIMESISDGIVVLDLDNRIIDVNPAARLIFESGAQTIGRSITDYFAQWPALLELALREGEQLEFSRLSEEYHYCEASCLPIFNERRNLLGKLLTIRDITAKKMTEERLWQQQQQIAVKEEREKMARDLHDNLGQVFGFINVQTQAIREYLKKGQLPTADHCLERITEVVQDAHETVRQTITTMRGELSSNKPIDLLGELKWQVGLFSQIYGIPVDIDYIGEHNLGLDPEIIEQLLNIIKECLNNAGKHAQARKVKIKVLEKDEELNIFVSDNGCGFNLKKVALNSNCQFGLYIMKERVEMIGGYLEVESALGSGTTVKVKIRNISIQQKLL